MKDEVYNRALFRRKSDAARNKLRDMGGIDSGPQGIMASSPELMQAAMPQRAMTPQLTGPRPSMQAPQMREQGAPMPSQPMPEIVPGMFPRPQQMQQPQMQQPQMQQPKPQGIQGLQQGAPALQQQQVQTPLPQQGMPQRPQPNQPIRFQEGGPVGPSFAERFGQNTAAVLSAATPATQRFDINATPVAQTRTVEPFSPADVMAALREQVRGDPEAEARAAEVEATLMDPDVSDEKNLDDAAGLITGETTREGRAAALSEMSGQRVPENASLDEINRAISITALGGAIGGPGSVAERISAAMMTGLSAQRETAVTRESEAARLREIRAQAAGRGAGKAPETWLDSQAGKNAFKLYSDMVSGNYSHDEAIAKMNDLTPGLGSTLSAAMGASGPAAAPSQTTAPAETPAPTVTPGVAYTADGREVRQTETGWVYTDTGQPYES